MTYTEKLWAIRTPDERWRASVYTRGNLSWLNTWPALKDAKLSSCKGDRIVRVTATYEVEE